MSAISSVSTFKSRVFLETLSAFEGTSVANRHDNVAMNRFKKFAEESINTGAS
jgi:hypothetical protein